MCTGCVWDLYRRGWPYVDIDGHRRSWTAVIHLLKEPRRKTTMPKVRFKGPVEEIQGTLYDVVFKKSPSGKTIVSKRPDTPALARRCKCVLGRME